MVQQVEQLLQEIQCPFHSKKKLGKYQDLLRSKYHGDKMIVLNYLSNIFHFFLQVTRPNISNFHSLRQFCFCFWGGGNKERKRKEKKKKEKKEKKKWKQSKIGVLPKYTQRILTIYSSFYKLSEEWCARFQQC